MDLKHFARNGKKYAKQLSGVLKERTTTLDEAAAKAASSEATAKAANSTAIETTT
jgi:hypothetical protein